MDSILQEYLPYSLYTIAAWHTAVIDTMSKT